MRPPEVVRRELVARWLDKANRDFDAAEHLLARSDRFREIIAFHCQQAVEKYLKARSWRNRDAPELVPGGETEAFDIAEGALRPLLLAEFLEQPRCFRLCDPYGLIGWSAFAVLELLPGRIDAVFDAYGGNFVGGAESEAPALNRTAQVLEHR